MLIGVAEEKGDEIFRCEAKVSEVACCIKRILKERIGI